MAFSEYHLRTDEELFDSIRQSDSRAFDVLYGRYFDKLFAFVYDRYRHREESKEVIQKVFYSFWLKRETLVISQSVSAYLYGSCKLLVIQNMRNEKRRNLYLKQFSYIATRSDNSNEEYQAVLDLENAIEQSILQLSPKCQQIFRMSRQQHLNIQTIAERLNLSTKTVENNLNIALTHLRKSLPAENLALLITISGTYLL